MSSRKLSFCRAVLRLERGIVSPSSVKPCRGWVLAFSPYAVAIGAKGSEIAFEWRGISQILFPILEVVYRFVLRETPLLRGPWRWSHDCCCLLSLRENRAWTTKNVRRVDVGAHKLMTRSLTKTKALIVLVRRIQNERLSGSVRTSPDPRPLSKIP